MSDRRRGFSPVPTAEAVSVANWAEFGLAVVVGQFVGRSPAPAKFHGRTKRQGGSRVRPGELTRSSSHLAAFVRYGVRCMLPRNCWPWSAFPTRWELALGAGAGQRRR